MIRKKVLEGFEQGKISHAFRNIFPLYYNGEYLGSVDLAFSSEVLQDNMNQLHGIDTHFILDKSLFDVHVWKSQKKVKYIQSIEHEDFLFALTSSKTNNEFTKDKIKLNQSLKDEISENIKHHGPFSLYHHDFDRVKIITFSPIKNIKNEKTVAYIVSYSDSYYLESMLHKYIYTNILFFIGLLILSFVITSNVKQRFFLQVRVDEEVEKNKKQQQTMFDQSRMAQMGEMISMIAHQWRQPLGTIAVTSIDLRMQSELQCFDLAQEKEAKEYEAYVNNSLEEIDAYVQNLTTTIDDFRNFYKPNKESVAVTLEHVILKSLDIIKATLLANNIEIAEEYNSIEEIELYNNEVMQVILNILKNAQDNFSEKETENPKITITTKNRIISICDNGGGLPKSILEKIFDPYFSTKDEKNGTGLGLYMSKIIIEEHHNGSLRAENKDNGICFLIELGIIDKKEIS